MLRSPRPPKVTGGVKVIIATQKAFELSRVFFTTSQGHPVFEDFQMHPKEVIEVIKTGKGQTRGQGHADDEGHQVVQRLL